MTEHQLNSHDLIPLIDIFLIPWKSIQEEIAFAALFFDCFSDQSDQNLTRNQLPILNIFSN